MAENSLTDRTMDLASPKWRMAALWLLAPSLLAVLAISIFLAKTTGELIETIALENAGLYSQAIEEFRTVYTSEVIETVLQAKGIEVSHDYKEKQHAIPLPATLSMILGRKIGAHESGAETHLYSPYPFPWRRKDSEEIFQDPFAGEAWEFLNANPQKPFYRFQEIEGRRVLRYAKADLMRSSCIKCHNTHPDTPKTGWKVGDVRGVLQVDLPLTKSILASQAAMKKIIIIVTVIGGLALICVLFVISRIKRIEELRKARKFSEEKAEALQVLIVNLKKSKEETAEKERELRETTEQLIQTEKLTALGELAAGVAHELNQPLNGIKIISQDIRRDLQKNRFDAEGLDANMGDVVNQVDKMTTIINEMRLFTRQAEEAFGEAMDINDAFRGVFKFLGQQLIDREIEVVQVLAPNLPSVEVDRVKMEQVFMNLILNARDALVETVSENRKIEIKSYADSGGVVFEVTDNASGIAPEIRNRLFEPFFTTKAPGQGTGLGLSISHRIVSEYGGRLEVESESGKGSTFRVTLPRVESGGDGHA